MTKAETVKKIDEDRERARLSHVRLCERAGVDTSTWWRNRKDPETITLDTIDALETAIRTKLAEAVA